MIELHELLMIPSIERAILDQVGIHEVTAIDHVFTSVKRYGYEGHQLVVNWLTGLTQKEIVKLGCVLGEDASKLYTHLSISRVYIMPSTILRLPVRSKARFKYNIKVPVVDGAPGQSKYYSVYYKRGAFTSLFNLQMVIVNLRHGERLSEKCEKALLGRGMWEFADELRVSVLHYLQYLMGCGLKLHDGVNVELNQGFHVPYEVVRYHKIKYGHPRILTNGFNNVEDIFDVNKDVTYHRVIFTFGLPKPLESSEGGYFYPDTPTVLNMLSGLMDGIETSDQPYMMDERSLSYYLSVQLPKALHRRSGMTQELILSDPNLVATIKYLFVDDGRARNNFEAVAGTHTAVNLMMARNANNKMCAKLLNDKNITEHNSSMVWSNLSLTYSRRGCIVDKA